MLEVARYGSTTPGKTGIAVEITGIAESDGTTAGTGSTCGIVDSSTGATGDSRLNELDTTI